MLKTMSPSIGAAVGTATHRAVEAALPLKKEGKKYAEAIEATAKESIGESIIAGVVWDDTTRNRQAAETQAIRQAKVAVEVLPINEIEVEGAYTAQVNADFSLVGHIDIRSGGMILDLKTGTTARANQAQYGAYALLCRSNDIEIDSIGEVYIKRVGVSKPQPDPVIVHYDIAAAEQNAYAVIHRIIDDLTRFRDTGDIWAWLPNPNSLMCSPDYCPAWGTAFCNAHKTSS